MLVSHSAWLCQPALVFVLPIQLTTTAWLRNGWPRQFFVLWHNSRCALLFHVLVPGGKWQTPRRSPSVSASWCNATFPNRHREPLLPPAAAVTSSLSASGSKGAPLSHHQRRRVAVAHGAVFGSLPTLTQPAFSVRSSTPDGVTFPRRLSGKSFPDLRRRPRWPPRLAPVLASADQFPLFRVHGPSRLPRPLTGTHLPVAVLERRVALRRRRPFPGLTVGREAPAACGRGT